MTYVLSFSSMLTTMRALAAVSLLSVPSDVRQPLADIIMSDRRELHVRLAKDAFAEILLDLLPYVEDSNLDDDESPELMTFKMPSADSLGNASVTVLRHALEQSLAYRVFRLCLLSLPEPPEALVGEISVKIDSCQSRALELLRSQGLNYPFIRKILW
ncbi:MAG: hypothetical protein K2J65_05845 [Duncaniella sp.]|nr:hypothetical protein [Duncaniella sp.]